jgi:hypothetical protein
MINHFFFPLFQNSTAFLLSSNETIVLGLFMGLEGILSV